MRKWSNLQRFGQSKVEEAFLVHKTLIKIILSSNLMGPNLTGAEGQVFGIGCEIFTVAGPVILQGIYSPWNKKFFVVLRV